MEWRSSSRGPRPVRRPEAEDSTLTINKPLEQQFQEIFDTQELPASLTTLILLLCSVRLNVRRICSAPFRGLDLRYVEWLGRGKSFRVFLMRPEIPSGTVNTGILHGQLMVGKMPVFTQGDLEDEDRIKDIMLEVRVLIHPPLFSHPNIVRFQGVQWENSFDIPGLTVPVLLLEFADHGSLADLLTRNPDLPLSSRLSLLYDIAMGLEALHKCGIAHGDVKPDNVLVFSHPTQGYIAKLGDFGFSLMDNSRTVMVGGTGPWKAPETKDPVSRSLISKTDLYSYGLLLWQTLLGSHNVFNYLLGSAGPGNDLVSMKEKDLILERACEWAEKFDADEKAFFTGLFKATLSKEPTKRSLESVLEVFWGDNAAIKLEDAMWRLISRNTLTRPETMVSIIKVLRRKRKNVMKQLRMSNIAAWSQPQLGLDVFAVAPESILDLDPFLRDLVVDNMQDLIDGKETVLPFTVAEAQLFLGMLYVSRSDGRQIAGSDVLRGLDLIRSAAEAGVGTARIFLYRTYSAFQVEIPQGVPISQYLQAGVAAGCRDLERYLAQVDPVGFREAISIRRHCFPQDWWESVKEDLQGNLPTSAVLAYPLVQLANYYISLNVSMQPIHVAATCGFDDVVEYLIDQRGANVDARTGAMDTPLLCACRQGHISVARVLLSKGANAALWNQNNENPLHFLWCFNDVDMSDICALLTSNGAEHTRQAHRQQLQLMLEWETTHSPGTPLHRAIGANIPSAVKALLLHGSDPWIPIVDGSMTNKTAVHVACHWHMSEILECLLGSSTIPLSGATNSLGEPVKDLLVCTIGESEQIIRHGSRDQAELFATLDILLRLGYDVSDCDGHGTHAIVAAVSHGRRDIVDYFIRKEGEHLLRLRYGPGNYTLLHFAVMYCQMQMARYLLQLGVDPRGTAGTRSELSILHLLASGGTGIECIKLAAHLVMAEGVPVDGAADDYETPLAVAFSTGNLVMAKALLRLGADPNRQFRRNYHGKDDGIADTILGTIVQYPDESTLPRLRFLFEETEGYQLSDLATTMTPSRWSALEAVAMNRPRKPENLELSRLPLGPGVANALRRNDEACVKAADLLFDRFGLSRAAPCARGALQLACLSANLPVLRLLLEKGVMPDEPVDEPPCYTGISCLQRSPYEDMETWVEWPGAVLTMELILVLQSVKAGNSSVPPPQSPLSLKSDRIWGKGGLTYSEFLTMVDQLTHSKVVLNFNVAWKNLEDACSELDERTKRLRERVDSDTLLKARLHLAHERYVVEMMRERRLRGMRS